jgi:uncharacterized membrane protein
MATGRERQRLRRASRGRGEAEENARQQDDADTGSDGPDIQEALGEDSDKGVFGQLKDTAADAALAVLKPVAKRAATKAAKWAVEKGPELVEDKVMPAVQEAGGPMGLVAGLAGDGNPAQALLSKLPGIGGDDDEDGGSGAADGTGKGRRMPIQQAVDVAAPIDVVYDMFTQFEDWPKFMHRLESANQKDDASVEFSEKLWGFRRQWEAEIVEQRPDERIVWESVSGLQHVGVVTFHELAERLTRVEVNVDIDPSGPMEKIARGARFAKRAVRADLKRFKAYVEMEEEETGSWRGEIEDGEVVTSPEEYEEQEAEAEAEEQPEAEAEAEEPEAEYEEDPDAEYEVGDPDAEFEEYEDEEPEEPEAEYEDEEEDEEEAEEEQPRRRTKTAARSRSRSTSRSSSNGSSKSESAAPKRSRSKSSSSRSRGSSNGSSKSTSKSKSGSSGGRSRSSSSKSSSSKGSSSGSRSRSSSSKSSSSGGRSRSTSSKSSGSSSRSRGSSKSGSSGKSRSKASSKS